MSEKQNNQILKKIDMYPKEVRRFRWNWTNRIIEIKGKYNYQSWKYK